MKHPYVIYEVYAGIDLEYWQKNYIGLCNGEVY